jgi:hypothetical protein
MEINKLFLDYILNRDIVSIKKHYKLDDYNFNNVYAFCLGFAEKNQDNIINYKHAKKAKEYKDLEENIKTLKHFPNRTMFYHFEAYNNGKKAESELKTELQKEIYQALFTIDKTYIVKEMKLDSIEFLRQQAFHLGYCARNNLEIKNDHCLGIQKKLIEQQKKYETKELHPSRNSYVKLYMGIFKIKIKNY